MSDFLSGPFCILKVSDEDSYSEDERGSFLHPDRRGRRGWRSLYADPRNQAGNALFGDFEEDEGDETKLGSSGKGRRGRAQKVFLKRNWPSKIFLKWAAKRPKIFFF